MAFLAAEIFCESLASGAGFSHSTFWGEHLPHDCLAISSSRLCTNRALLLKASILLTTSWGTLAVDPAASANLSAKQVAPQAKGQRPPTRAS